MEKHNFKLEKLKIKAYTTIDRKEKDLVETFEVMFNPQSYSLIHENVYDQKQSSNTIGVNVKYLMTRPQNLSLDLIFDDTVTAASEFDSELMGKKEVNTQAKKSQNEESVHSRIEKFRILTMKMNGDTHQPYFLIVQWGHFHYKCRMKSFEVRYTLFNRGGEAIRAEVKANFVYSLNKTERAKLENKSSPDLTHSRTIKSEDTLPLMAQKMYGDPGYHVKLARANNLNSLRKLTVGKTLKLPPIEK